MKCYSIPAPLMQQRAEWTQRFWAKVDIMVDGCWLWTACTNGDGYGRFSITRHEQFAAHRVSYELLVAPIPDGLELDHLCRVHECVRPDHLEPVTTRDNLLRGVGFAALNVAKTHCPQGHPYDDENTRLTASGRRVCLTCDRARWRAEPKDRRNARRNERRRLRRARLLAERMGVEMVAR